MIYIVTHKTFNDETVKADGYRVLHVGNNINCKEYYLRDDTGDNISYKNPNYCELTGLYWIWKNDTSKSNDAVGLCHYRRFFTYKIDNLLYTYFDKSPRILSTGDAKAILEGNDVILPSKERIFRTVKEFYGDYHDLHDLEIVRDIIKKISPEYVCTYDEVLDSHSFYYANMIIARKSIINDYCSWLFKVMNEVEKVINAENIKDNYQSRIFGFISERLLQVWVVHNHLRVKEMPVFNTENKGLNLFTKNANRLKHLIGKIKR